MIWLALSLVLTVAGMTLARGRTWSTAALLVAFLVVVTHISSPVRKAEAQPIQSLPINQLARGQTLFQAKGGTGCHTHSRLPGPPNPVTGSGPDLTGLKADRAYLQRWLENPAAIKPDTWMPDLDLQPDEIDALITFLLSP